MKYLMCVACESEEDLQHHHIVTRAEGGSDDETNLLTLCTACHDKVHSRQVNGTYNHGQRTRAALQAAKARGVKLGNPRPETASFHNRKTATAAGKKGGKAAQVSADRFAALIQPLLNNELAGLSANAVAHELNRRGVQTARGGTWTATSVINLKARVSS
jgi:hypothetical protein